MNNDKKRILFILHLPPPVHGAAVVGKHIQCSQAINSEFDCRYVNMSLAASLSDIGSFSFVKLWKYIVLLFVSLKNYLLWKPHIVYVTPNAGGKVFFKDFVLIQILKLLRAKIVVHYHNKGVRTFSTRPIYDQCYKLFFKNIKVILLAERLYSDVEKYVKRADTFVCHNGIPKIKLQEENTASLSHEKPTKTLRLLFLSNMIAAKGVWTLLYACRELRNELDFQCHFVGGWGDIAEDEFLRAVSIYDLDDVVFCHGPLYGAEKDAMFKRADIFVFPTEYECFPLVLLEAMQFGLPCISTLEGGIPNIIDDGYTGILIPKNNVDALERAIRKLATNPDVTTKMGERAKQKFDNQFTIEIFEQRLIDIFRQCLN